ncbi:hypothetical protein P7C70_g811, partial [Phenoliferia sp. Uapishka_3]
MRVQLVASVTIPLIRKETGITLVDGSVDLAAVRGEVLRTRQKYLINAKRGGRDSTKRFLKSRKRSGIPLKLVSPSVWTGAISIGNPPQIFNMYFDSGSTDLTLPSISCLAKACGNRARYSPNASTTAVSKHQTLNSAFADGSVSTGAWWTDTVSAGNLVIAKQSLLAATAISTTVATINSDGMGLAFIGLSSTGTSSVPVSMYEQGSGNYVGLRLSSIANTSSISLGDMSLSAVPGHLAWYNVAVPSDGVKTYWQVELSTPLVNRKPSLVKRVTHIIDSGTTLIVAPIAGATEFWANVPGSAQVDAGHWTFVRLST